MSYQPILESFMCSWASKHFKNIKTFNVTKEKSEAQPHLLSVSKLFNFDFVSCMHTCPIFYLSLKLEAIISVFLWGFILCKSSFASGNPFQTLDFSSPLHL